MENDIINKRVGLGAGIGGLTGFLFGGPVGGVVGAFAGGALAKMAPRAKRGEMTPDREAVYRDLREGKVVIERLETLDDGKKINVPGGLIHHWIGTVFVPGATLAQVVAFEQDYDNQLQYFQPDVKRSKILRHNGSDFVVDIRFYKKKIITTVLDTTHEVHYQPVDATHEWSRSHTTRVQEVEDAGEPHEKLKREGRDNGFLWRMDTYWRFEEKDGGTYIESQSVSLTRDIPMGLGWMIGPYVNSVPRESLTFTLDHTRSAILQRIGATDSHRISRNKTPD